MTSIASFLAGTVSGAVLVWGYFAVKFTRPVKPRTPITPQGQPRHRAPLRNEWNDDGRTSFTVPAVADEPTCPVVRNQWGRA